VSDPAFPQRPTAQRAIQFQVSEAVADPVAALNEPGFLSGMNQVRCAFTGRQRPGSASAARAELRRPDQQRHRGGEAGQEDARGGHD
jgi:hypothetical protein